MSTNTYACEALTSNSRLSLGLREGANSVRKGWVPPNCCGMYVFVYVCMYVCMFICTCVCTFPKIVFGPRDFYAQLYACVYMQNKCSIYMYMYMYIYVNMSVRTHSEFEVVTGVARGGKLSAEGRRSPELLLYVCVYVCMHTYKTYLYTYIEEHIERN